jgi:hypothetical protein
MNMTASQEKIEKKERKKKTHSVMKSVGFISFAALISTFAVFTIIATATTSQAYATTTNDRAAQQESIDVSGEIVDSTFCENGELIELSGDVHIVSRFSQTESGQFQILQHVNWQGVRGEGLTTGADYRVPNSFNSIANFDIDDELGTATDTTSFQLVSQGRLAPDLLVHATFHVTEIDDEVNTEIQNFSVECR